MALMRIVAIVGLHYFLTACMHNTSGDYLGDTKKLNPVCLVKSSKTVLVRTDRITHMDSFYLAHDASALDLGSHADRNEKAGSFTCANYILGSDVAKIGRIDAELYISDNCYEKNSLWRMYANIFTLFTFPNNFGRKCEMNIVATDHNSGITKKYSYKLEADELLAWWTIPLTVLFEHTYSGEIRSSGAYRAMEDLRDDGFL